jgi:hypothetical protein
MLAEPSPIAGYRQLFGDIGSKMTEVAEALRVRF